MCTPVSDRSSAIEPASVPVAAALKKRGWGTVSVIVGFPLDRPDDTDTPSPNIFAKKAPPDTSISRRDGISYLNDQVSVSPNRRCVPTDVNVVSTGRTFPTFTSRYPRVCAALGAAPARTTSTTHPAIPPLIGPSHSL